MNFNAIPCPFFAYVTNICLYLFVPTVQLCFVSLELLSILSQYLVDPVFHNDALECGSVSQLFGICIGSFKIQRSYPLVWRFFAFLYYLLSSSFSVCSSWNSYQLLTLQIKCLIFISFVPFFSISLSFCINFKVFPQLQFPTFLSKPLF